jgi:two-component system, OmpR family, sensor kinase
VRHYAVPHALSVYYTETTGFSKKTCFAETFRHMRQPRSIRFQLSSVFVLFFLLVIVLGLFGISWLREFNKVSTSIVEVWLPSTRILGDLNNFTSDFRAAEGRDVLSSAGSDIGASEDTLALLDRSIAQAQRSYELVGHDPAEAALYAQFKDKWRDYRGIAGEVLALSQSGRTAEATTMYLTRSQSAYDGASDVLGQLTSRNVANAQAAANRVAATYRQALWLIGTAILVAGVMVAAGLWYISRRISTPLLHLAKCMRDLAYNKTDIDVQGTERHDEIGAMARAAVVFQRNAIELMVSQRGLAQQASMLEEKLAAEQQLTAMQRNFVSMASHEFRTPLTIIDGNARRLIKLKERMPAAEVGERAGKIRAAVLRMTHLMDNLLNSSRLIEQGAELYFHPTEIDLAGVLADVCQLHREIAAKSQIIERFEVDSLRMSGDPKLLHQVFSNLLSNAIKYSPTGKPITIRAAIEAGDAVISIEDHGIGIPAADIDRVFARYWRGSNVSGIVGTGIGLYLVRMIVDLHHGRIAVESIEGKGSCFTVRLPLYVDDQHAADRPGADESAEAGVHM